LKNEYIKIIIEDIKRESLKRIVLKFEKAGN